MATVIFYEKPGCINNTRQKKWLRDSGHGVIEKDLLTQAWKATELRKFFANLPVSQWFNLSAPRVKSGEIDPVALDAESALALMAADPILIRRPLMQANGIRMVGFDPATVDRWIGLTPQSQTDDLEVCARTGTGIKSATA